MLSQEIVIPLWTFVVLVMVSGVAFIEWVFLPTFRWYLRRRTNKALAEISNHLRISIRPFQLTKKQVIADRLLHDPQVAQAIKQHAEDNDISQQKSLKLAKKYVWETVPSFNAYIYQRCSYWFAKKMSWHLYRVRGRVLDAKKLMNVDPDATIVFVLNHRSNMDYILVSYLASQSTTISYAVGEWAKFWPLKSLIQSMGAFFVHRGSKNTLYRKVLERYVHMATEQGVCQAVFPEGGLTKDGKIRPAKLGFIDYMLRSYDIKTKRDIVFVPVGINFDRTIEDRSLLRKLDPKAPNRSPWFIISTTIHFLFKNSLLRSTKERWRRFGYAGVNFGNPMSLKEYCTEQEVFFNELPREQRFQEISKLTEYLMESISKVIPILPIPLIANILLDNKNGLSSFDIKIKVDSLIKELQNNGAPIKNDERPKERTIDHAIEMLFMRQLILLKNDKYFINENEIALLEYYANSISHFRSNT
ncbi:1-acyl-sn-glycerol-3-phosphate acyltransferase [Candidatus Uabimicrobium sp. HlEnr_7]|uniref:1-acyl-sn-glycerol-3-phosphate acyltransferase n=1 Tax=Candidatus Uabimicrobium helgolandensis TaxID=3095367 RepID=UPI0035562CDD